LSIRFQADNDLKNIIVDATLRREPRIDFQTAQAARLDDLDDEAVLRLAASQSRILGSHDKRTMPKVLASFVASGGTSPDSNLGRRPSERLDQPDGQDPVLIRVNLDHVLAVPTLFRNRS
jgi:hypothetical protein